MGVIVHVGLVGCQRKRRNDPIIKVFICHSVTDGACFATNILFSFIQSPIFTRHMDSWNKDYIYQPPLQMSVAMCLNPGLWDVNGSNVCNFQEMSFKGRKEWVFFFPFPFLLTGM